MKLENLLLDEDNNIRLIDFGLCAVIQPGKLLRVHCGSPSYAAPEIVGRKLYEGPPVDVWSLGVVLFAMVSGYLPFHAAKGDKQELCNKIMRGSYNAPDFISSDLEKLIRRMLTTQPDRRISLAGILEHPWVSGGGGGSTPSFSSVPKELGAPTRSDTTMAVFHPVYDETGEVSVNPVILDIMATHGFEREAVTASVERLEHTYMTTTYFLLAGVLRREALKREFTTSRLSLEESTSQTLSSNGGQRRGSRGETIPSDSGVAVISEEEIVDSATEVPADCTALMMNAPDEAFRHPVHIPRPPSAGARRPPSAGPRRPPSANIRFRRELVTANAMHVVSVAV